MLDFLKKKQSREDYLRGQLGAFAHENRDVLIIVADPKTDFMFVAHKDRMVLGRLKSLDGAKLHVVHDVLRQSAMKSKFDAAIDHFTGGMVDIFQLGLKEGNQFYSFISDVLFAFQARAKEWAAAKEKRDQILANSPKVEAGQLTEAVK